MPKTRKLLVVLFSCAVLTIGTAIAIEKVPAGAESNVSSKELLEAAQSAYDVHKVLYQRNGGVTAEDLYVWSKRCMAADRDLNPAVEDATKAIKAHLQRMEELGALAKARHEGARGTAADVMAAKYYRTEAELMLARLKDGG